jgi:hypothetical protein
MTAETKENVVSAIEAINTGTAERRTVTDIARDLGAIFARRANETTDEDRFVADNFVKSVVGERPDAIAYILV